MDLKDLIDYCQALALDTKFTPNYPSVYRGICRAYSEKFHTALHEVYKLDPEFILINFYESELENVDLDEHLPTILDKIYALADPEYVAEREAELRRFVEDTEAEEQERLDKGVPLLKFLLDKQKESKVAFDPEKRLKTIKNVVKKKEVEDPDALPKSGMIDLSYLDKEEEESE